MLRDEFGLAMTDDEIGTCIDVMERRGEEGAPHLIFRVTGATMPPPPGGLQTASHLLDIKLWRTGQDLTES